MKPICWVASVSLVVLIPHVLLGQRYQTRPPAAAPASQRVSAIGIELAVDRSLDAVLTEIERGDFKAARRALEMAPKRQRSIERPIAELVVYLMTLDVNRAAGALEELRRTDPLSAQRCREAGLSSTIASLGGKRAPLEKEIVGDALTRLAMAFPDGRFPRTAAIAYVAKALRQYPTHLTADLDSERRRALDAAATHARLEKLELNLSLTQAEVAGLNRQAKDLLRSVGALQGGATALEERLRLDETHLAELNRKVDCVVDNLIARQTQLEQLIRQRDARVMSMIESVRSELRSLGGTVADQRAALNSLTQRYPALMAGSLQPPGSMSREIAGLAADARSPSMFARILGYAAGALSIGARVGRVNINVLGILSALAEILL